MQDAELDILRSRLTEADNTASQANQGNLSFPLSISLPGCIAARPPSLLLGVTSELLSTTKITTECESLSAPTKNDLIGTNN